MIVLTIISFYKPVLFVDLTFGEVTYQIDLRVFPVERFRFPGRRTNHSRSEQIVEMVGMGLSRRCSVSGISAIGILFSFQGFLKKNVYFVERYDIEVVVKIDVVGSGDNQQFLVVSRQPFVGVFAEITRMGLGPVYHQYGAAYFADVGEDRHIDECQGTGFDDSLV